jgi:ABC-type enterochelin transport system permease subunit
VNDDQQQQQALQATQASAEAVAQQATTLQANALDYTAERRTFWFAVLIFTAVCAVEATVLFHGLPQSSSPELLGRILGTMDAAMLAALYYIFGSSAGSARKNHGASGVTR